MMGLARPPNRWNADTATPPVLETPAAAVGSEVDSMVKADVRRLEPWYGFKNGCVVSPRQVGSCAERVRSLMESGMNPDFFANEAADFAAGTTRNWFFKLYEPLAEKCESEIEQIMLAALIAYFLDINIFQFGPASGPKTEGAAKNACAWLYNYPKPCCSMLSSQVAIADYRVDFLLMMRGADPKEYGVVIECDGHDFHERTKAQAKRDRKRDRDLQALGYRVMRFTGSEICRDAFACAREVWEVWTGFESKEMDRDSPLLDQHDAKFTGPQS